MHRTRKRGGMTLTMREAAGQLLLGNRFLVPVILVAVAVYSFGFAPEAITPDGSTYMLLGKNMMLGRYPDTFFHRMPMLPLVFALLSSAGLQILFIRFLVPLAFIILALASTYLLVRELAGVWHARLATVLLLCFPQFWRWGAKFLVDIPLLSFSALSLYFMLRGLRDEKYFLHMGAVFSIGVLTKLTFFLVPLAIMIYLLVTRRKVFLNKRFLAGLLLPCIVFSAAFLAVSLSRSADDFMQISFLVERSVDDEALTPFTQLLTGQYSDILNLAKLAMFPVLIFLPFGVYAFIKRRKGLSLFYVTFLSLFFFFLSPVRLRLYSPLYPFIMLFTAEGLSFLLDGIDSRHARAAAVASFSVLLLVSFADALFLLSLDFGMNWGINTLSSYTGGLNGMIASEYIPHYLNITSDVVIDKEWSAGFFRGNGSRSLLQKKCVDYVILSVYGEFARNPSEETYHPMLGPFEITFIERPYTGERVPPDFTFGSELYRRLESDPGYTKINEIRNPDGQLVFVIYETGLMA
ncbi:MAG: glycosyltransferase family 39 protein [Candidatus Aenigmarchaeota archaeon]|nr:glycosyltransferase family 39 protein [Candidatus Aenigmarchaeota archaeon]